MAEVKKSFLSVDGNTATALASYNFTEVASIYPITPSSTMAELVEQYACEGKKNCFGTQVKVVEMQSEAGASGTVHGALQAGALSTTYTASQGLLLMIPNIYKWVGECLPAVLHVSARSLATRSLSIFGDHQDVYACRQTGATMICAHSVQECADLAPVAHLTAIKSRVPVIHFFDGFRTSHEIQNVEFVSDEDWSSLIDQDQLQAFRKSALNPHSHPVTRGGAENDDIYFQGREAQNSHFANVVKVAEEYFKEATRLTGRTYAPFVYYGAEDAERVIVAMGSVTECIREVVDSLNAKGEKVGLVKVHLYRPFSAKHLVDVIPASVKKIAVLDRTKEMGATGEPLYLDVVSALEQEGRNVEVVLGGRYGLSSKDTQPKHMKSVFDFLNAENNWHSFTVGINDDVTHLSIPVDEEFHVEANYTSCLFYGLGSDGTVSANKSSIKIIGDATGQYAQAYFAYDSRKAGGVTRSHLRFGKEPIHSTYYIEHADFLSCSLDSYIFKFDMLKCLKKGGTFLLNTDIPASEIEARLPNRLKRQLAKKNAKFYIIDANAIAGKIGLGRRTNTILQASFFYLNQSIMPYAEAQDWMKKFAKKAYGKKGDDIVQMNWEAIDAGAEGLVEVPVKAEWAELPGNRVYATTGDEYFDSYVNVIGSLDGYDLPVSKFTEYELLDGTMRNDVTFKEKRSIADRVPVWHKEYCIQCNQCAFVCPHATIRPFLLNDEEFAGLPENVKDDVLPAIGGPQSKGLRFRIQVTPRNCVGCGLCVVECPGKPVKDENGNLVKMKALSMVESKSQFEVQEPAADYLYKHVEYKTGGTPVTTVKGASFLMPYVEVSGACAGCGETPYYRLASQLFGRDMLIANATGCSSIYNGSTPLTPFCTDKNGEGVAWANSLFEDNAEYGYGMRVATDYKLADICRILEANKAECEEELQAAIDDYIAHIKDRDYVRTIKDNLVALVEKSTCEGVKEVLAYKNDLVDKSVWIVGGDGWAYDIGYGGLDHVLANEEDVNVMVLDTEVYSNTGGQSSKSSQTGSIAKFTASGKKSAKKFLALIAMSYGHVYVAQVSMGANKVQAIKALKEAESYNGPSIVICYSPCANHGIKGGLANAQITEKKAVECGYFPIFRYDPRLKEQGKDPLQIDCQEPDFSKFRDFLMTETRYSQLPKVNPEHCEELLTKSQKYAEDRWNRLKKFHD
ncbi:MAG: pyruvate:ferredoxin (flavodoxin) oxidoreductase [Erysipelotrichaceae bacterium]|nr:pyruvate:ferredoxin (flavodoxin) oxidoreductase [Erysipelotrichaceae bacterium]